ncbi:MAG: phytoene desaturase [Sphingobacteriales bacterium]|nr:MAG: phytoene desaturase [Sphingobacteriales bacterium]TAF83134.1 MAG: phytoene desaturase [Sphingobacteriales bacterium]
MEHKNIHIIGSGFAGLTAAALLAKKGYNVTILEKNKQPGGRAGVWQSNGFTFDMGPSWYWMPDVFENYFALFGKKPSDYYQLKRLDPAYRLYFDGNEIMDIPANMQQLEALFESYEAGSTAALRKFMAQAAYKYKTAMSDYVFRPSHSITEFLDVKLILQSLRIHMLKPMSKHVKSYFKNPKLIKLLEFPVLFLGATAQKIPAMYSLMNYADLALGTWYPMGGMNKIVQAMVKVAEENGVKTLLNTEVLNIKIENGKAVELITNKGNYTTDFVVAAADYQHIDQKLLTKPYQNYSPHYWQSRTMSPSSLLFYVGLNQKVNHIKHHNLFFDEDLDQHAKEIYDNPQWPSKPLFYVCASSLSDTTVAPPNTENLFFLIPLAPGLSDTPELREKYYHLIMDRFERITGNIIRGNEIVKRSFAMNDFETEYHSYKGNAYGLANTLTQTAFLKPSMRNKKVANLLYSGQLTVPGPGVPPAIISGQVVATEASKYLQKM